MLTSLRRIAGLLCYAFAAFVAFVLAAVIYRRISHGWGYSVAEDLTLFGIMALIVTVSAVAGYFLRPGSFSLRTLLIAVTVLILVMGAIAIVFRPA
jgi:FtsH-binding integral membrane protein